MKFKEYQQLTKRTLPNLDEVYSNDIVLLPHLHDVKIPQDMLNLLHMRLGIVSEIEELILALRNKDSINIGEELTDMLWYISNDLNICLRMTFIDMNQYVTVSNIQFMFVPMVTDGGYKIEDGEGWFPSIVFNASKLTDYTKKWLAYNKPYTSDQYIKTIQYLLGAINNLAITYDINLEDYMERNIAKLQSRYPEKFTEHAAINRDLVKERAILERPLTPDEAQDPIKEPEFRSMEGGTD